MDRMDKVVLLTGATGFLGFRTLEVLVEQPDVKRVLATGRTLKAGMKVHSPKVEYQLGDLANADFVDSLTENITDIVHCAALCSPWGAFEEFYRVNVITQENLIAAAYRRNIKRFVYISTPAVYFNYKDRFEIKENEALPDKCVNHYATTKRVAEILLEKTNLDYIILRPRALTGRGDTVIMPRLIRAVKSGRLKIIGDGKNIVDITAVSNAVDAIMLGMRVKGDALRQTYNITNGEPVVIWDVIRLMLNMIGLNLENKKVPYKIVFLIAWFMEKWARWTGKRREPIYTRYSISTLAKSFTMDISKAKELLGYTPRTSTMESINEFVQWYNADEKG